MIRQKKEYAGQTNYDLKFFPPGVGVRGVGGGGGGHGELPDLCRSLPSRRPGLVFLSSQVFTTLSPARRSSTLAALAPVFTVVTLAAFRDGYRGS